MISVVTFKWKPKPGYRSQFDSAHVNTMMRMVARHYRKPHRFICVTDDPTGLDGAVEYVPLWNDCATLANPTWPNGPSCYRRLKVFSKEFAEVAGPRFICMDLDMVIVDDLAPIFDRPEPFLIFKTHLPSIPICGSMFMVNAGEFSDVWDRFDPIESPLRAKAAGHRGSDQGWLALNFGKDVAGWGSAEGVHSYMQLVPRMSKFALAHAQEQATRRLSEKERIERIRRRIYTTGLSQVGALPAGSRIIVFTGKPDPWDEEALKLSPWIREHYR